MLDLIVITGASKGIGASIANMCSNICTNMELIASSDKINSVYLENMLCNSFALQLDLSNYNEVYNKLGDCISHYKNINSIGIVLAGAQIGEPGGIENTELENWEKLFKCNVLGNLAVVKACLPIIKNGAKTRIVFFGGGGAAFSYPEFSAYSLSKVSTVRAAENLSIELSKINKNVSVISIAPGAVATAILDKVLANGGSVRTKTDISEPTNFVRKFLLDEFPSQELNGKFLHVRDDIDSVDFSNDNLFKLRRIE